MKRVKKYMKFSKILLYLILFNCQLSINCQLAKAQDVPPSGVNFKYIPSPGFYYFLGDSSIWQYKGSTYGWTKLSTARKVKYQLDSLKNTIQAGQFDTVHIYNAIALKVDKIAGKALSDNNFSDADSLKLLGLQNFDHITIIGGSGGIKYGELYNWYAAYDARKITSSDDWRVTEGFISWQDFRDIQVLGEYLDPDGTSTENTAGGELKTTGTTYWDSPNTGATNSVGFNAKGSGYRMANGTFSSLKVAFYFWSANGFENETNKGVSSIVSEYATLNYPAFGEGSNMLNKNCGASIRLAKLTTELSEGQSGTYTGNDGRIYPTIVINGIEYLAENLCETKWRNGDAIPIVTDNSEWAALSTGAMSSYDNDQSNVLTVNSYDIHDLDSLKILATSGIIVELSNDSLKLSLDTDIISTKSDSIRHWRQEIEDDDDNDYALPFTLKSNATIMYNGVPLRPSQWSGAGTGTLTLILNTKRYDDIVISN